MTKTHYRIVTDDINIISYFNRLADFTRNDGHWLYLDVNKILSMFETEKRFLSFCQHLVNKTVRPVKKVSVFKVTPIIPKDMFEFAKLVFDCGAGTESPPFGELKAPPSGGIAAQEPVIPCRICGGTDFWERKNFILGKRMRGLVCANCHPPIEGGENTK